MGDGHGNVIHLGERDCSIQRRHQKIVEEAPSPALSAEERARLGALAVQGTRAIGYSNAGTLEFLRDQQGNFYFLEMNTRIQVEHGVTEFITGLDLVKEQLLVAAGEKLSLRQEDVTLRGHAIECRINAEDPEQGFSPRFGAITEYLPPGGPGIRMDSHLYAGYVVPMHYDSLLAKVIAWAPTREEATRRMARALDELHIGGLPTTIPFVRRVMDEAAFRSGEVYTDYIERVVVSG
jgi:acetyl-CoA carboxylase biotin carboxylase subunit